MKSNLQTTDGKNYDVPVEGSLGLLALGYRGLVAWRAKREASNYSLQEHLYIPKPKKKNNGKKTS
ncbi:MAG: hypothetical protein AAGJ18_19320 [Bacteroidota bacterium]